MTYYYITGIFKPKEDDEIEDFSRLESSGKIKEYKVLITKRNLDGLNVVKIGDSLAFSEFINGNHK